MDTRLARLIADYQVHVAKAVALLESAGFRRPNSNTEWAIMRTPASPKLDGLMFRKHGYGCFVKGPTWAVDFDFGDTGQIDGFDAWRLAQFAGDKLAQYGFESPEDLQSAFRHANESGDIVYSGYILYYIAR